MNTLVGFCLGDYNVFGKRWGQRLTSDLRRFATMKARPKNHHHSREHFPCCSKPWNHRILNENNWWKITRWSSKNRKMGHGKPKFMIFHVATCVLVQNIHLSGEVTRPLGDRGPRETKGGDRKSPCSNNLWKPKVCKPHVWFWWKAEWNGIETFVLQVLIVRCILPR